MNTHKGVARLQSLPYDLLRAIFQLLGDDDVVNIVNTCTTLRATFDQDESVWRELSARFGVTDNALFENRPFRIIFKRLLRKYGALLELWASDYSFKGNILEFHFAPNRWGPGQSHVLVGELWRFPAVWNEEPQLPHYLECIQIGFGLRIGQEPDQVIHSFNVHEEMAHAATYHREEPLFMAICKPQLRLVSAYHSPFTVQNILQPIRHPDFPSTPSDPWYDTARVRPRLQVIPSPNVDNDVKRNESGELQWGDASDEQERAFAHPSRRFRTGIFARDSVPVPKPLALCIDGIAKLSEGDLPDIHMPPHGFGDARTNADPRYYPLKQKIRAGVDPSSADWKPESLEGLWFGSYGPHGTECLYVYLDAPAQTVRALKITGDVNVPRGVQSWEMRLDSPRTWQELQLEQIAVEVPVHKAFDGIGTVSEHGFTDPEPVRVTVMIIGMDEIGVNWFWSHTNRYVRYTGRPPSELSTASILENAEFGQ